MSQGFGTGARYRAGVIGVGRKGLTIDDERKCPVNYCEGPASHAAAYAALPEIDLVAVADPDPGALARARERHPNVRGYSTYEEMLARESLDIVSVATQAPEHAAATIAAVEAGARAIVCEKAMATSMAEADAMLVAAHERGAVLVIDHPRRYHPTFVAARTAIEEGSIGRLQMMLGTVGGWMVHNGSHFFDLFRFFAGPAEAVWASVSAEDGNDGHGSARVQFANGVVGLLDARSQTEVQFALHGERGSITIDGTVPGFALTTYAAHDVTHGAPAARWFQGAPCKERHVSQVAPEPGEGTMATLIRDALACIAGGGEPRSSGSDGAAALELAVAAFASSARGGAAVQLPLAERDERIASR